MPSNKVIFCAAVFYKQPFAEVISEKSSLRIYDVFAKGSSTLDIHLLIGHFSEIDQKGKYFLILIYN